MVNGEWLVVWNTLAQRAAYHRQGVERSVTPVQAQPHNHHPSPVRGDITPAAYHTPCPDPNAFSTSSQEGGNRHPKKAPQPAYLEVRIPINRDVQGSFDGASHNIMSPPTGLSVRFLGSLYRGSAALHTLPMIFRPQGACLVVVRCPYTGIPLRFTPCL